MSLKLFSHNQSAFEEALAMLEETGKAAVVHPTGTGKSYIGFKLCEQFPEKIVCWLSPSEYIYKTQLENLKEDSDGWQPENVKFFTYAKLMLMSDAELEEIKPDYIILDEFHRCGAEMWGEGVNRLLDMYPDIPLLGLTATSIRYLDNQRNMANELFDGNIASEMTLGEAIVRGILNPPKYVMSVFAYQEDYDRLKCRVHRAKSKAVRDKAEQYLEALRRALEMADGMDVIFEKHITDRTGKYIVFCSNIDHLREMQSNVAAWFSKIDKEPHIYTAYSLDSATEKEFEDFKKDESDHLKLLFCIDMLNEGVHVENISGVILFRPTVSPIIYKQQIGRALSASKTKDPIIFDIVNNIENLASIDTIQKEMRIAISYYRERGESNYIVNEHFQVIDEVREAKELFDHLSETLTGNWNIMFECCKKYKQTFGDLMVPKAYKTPEGYSLGTWLDTQRRVYRGEQNGNLDDEKIRLLESIGMKWDPYKDIIFERNINALKRFYKENGHLKVPHGYVTDDGIRLGDFVVRLRAYRKAGIKSSYISPDRIEQLDSIGMIWDVPDMVWQQNIAALRNYYDKHGNIDIPKGYISDDGVDLHSWLKGIKYAYRSGNTSSGLSEEQIKELNDLGMIWGSIHDIKWMKSCENACKYYSQFGNWSIPKDYRTSDGQRLQTWVQNQRTKFSQGKLKQEQIDLLNAVNFVWEAPTPEENWEKYYTIAVAYFKEFGNLDVKRRTEYMGVPLGAWLQTQRKIRLGGKEGQTLTDEQILRLDAIGMRWHSIKDARWLENLNDVLQYYSEYENLDVSYAYISPNGNRIAVWLKKQKDNYKAGKLTDIQLQQLETVGFIEWCNKPDSWDKHYSEAKAYYEENGDLLIPYAYVSESGDNIGLWIRTQRTHYNRGLLDKSRVQKLEAIGMVWDLKQQRWLQNYKSAERYYRRNGSLSMSADYVDENGVKLYWWILDLRRAYRGKKKKNLSEQQIQMLNSIGMTW